jgi:hypothetical protein
MAPALRWPHWFVGLQTRYGYAQLDQGLRWSHCYALYKVYGYECDYLSSETMSQETSNIGMEGKRIINIMATRCGNSIKNSRNWRVTGTSPAYKLNPKYFTLDINGLRGIPWLGIADGTDGKAQRHWCIGITHLVYSFLGHILKMSKISRQVPCSVWV